MSVPVLSPMNKLTLVNECDMYLIPLYLLLTTKVS